MEDSLHRACMARHRDQGLVAHAECPPGAPQQEQALDHPSPAEVPPAQTQVCNDFVRKPDQESMVGRLAFHCETTRMQERLALLPSYFPEASQVALACWDRGLQGLSAPKSLRAIPMDQKHAARAERFAKRATID